MKTIVALTPSITIRRILAYYKRFFPIDNTICGKSAPPLLLNNIELLLLSSSAKITRQGQVYKSCALLKNSCNCLFRFFSLNHVDLILVIKRGKFFFAPSAKHTIYCIADE